MYCLRTVDPRTIAFSQKNPRDETEDKIISSPDFEQLKDSVARFGVLVPIVAHVQNSTAYPYVLVDGERRLRASLATGIKEVPVHVADKKDEMDELVQAFHIHMVRKSWRSIATARAIKQIYTQLRAKRPDSREKALLDEIQNSLGCSDEMFKSYSRVIRYGDDILVEVENGQSNLKYSHLIEFEASLVEPLTQSYAEHFKSIDKDEIREQLIAKARSGMLDTRSLLTNVAPVLARAEDEGHKDTAAKLVKGFLETVKTPAGAVREQYDQEYPPNNEKLADLCSDIQKYARSLDSALKRLSPHQLRVFPKYSNAIRNALGGLKKTIGNTVRALGRQGDTRA